MASPLGQTTFFWPFLERYGSVLPVVPSKHEDCFNDEPPPSTTTTTHTHTRGGGRGGGEVGLGSISSNQQHQKYRCVREVCACVCCGSTKRKRSIAQLFLLFSELQTDLSKLLENSKKKCAFALGAAAAPSIGTPFKSSSTWRRSSSSVAQ